jgi:DNA mismatch repair protein Mlh1 C-terminus
MVLYGNPVYFLSDWSYEFFYQLGLSEFGNFGTIEIVDGLVLRDLLALAMEANESDGMTQQAQAEEIEVFHLFLNSYSLRRTF